MTTMAGRKLRTYREAQTPRMTRRAFAAWLARVSARKVSATAVQGWEEEGKRPEHAPIVNMLAAAGVVDHADWYRPALCTCCERPSDDPVVAECTRHQCPLAVRVPAPPLQSEFSDQAPRPGESPN